MPATTSRWPTPCWASTTKPRPSWRPFSRSILPTRPPSVTSCTSARRDTMFLLQVPVVARLMERCGIVCRWRAGMTLDLQRLSEHPALPAEYELRGWDHGLLPEVARLDFNA